MRPEVDLDESATPVVRDEDGAVVITVRPRRTVRRPHGLAFGDRRRLGGRRRSSRDDARRSPARRAHATATSRSPIRRLDDRDLYAALAGDQELPKGLYRGKRCPSCGMPFSVLVHRPGHLEPRCENSCPTQAIEWAAGEQSPGPDDDDDREAGTDTTLDQTMHGLARPLDEDPEADVDEEVVEAGTGTNQGLFARVPKAAAFDKRLSGSDVKLLLAIAAHMNRKNQAWPGNKHLAGTARISHRQFFKSREKLLACGYLRWNKTPGRRAKLYTVKFSHLARRHNASFRDRAEQSS